jgi:hypothetical protein
MNMRAHTGPAATREAGLSCVRACACVCVYKHTLIHKHIAVDETGSDEGVRDAAACEPFSAYIVCDKPGLRATICFSKMPK